MSATLIQQFDLLASSLGGVAKLRELILSLAVRGKLVPQDPADEPASVLLQKIRTEKERLIAEGKIKKDKPLALISDDEKPFELPEGWEWVRLGAITNFGNTTKAEKISDETWILDLEDIEKDTSRLLQKIQFATRKALSDKNCFEPGDVLYGKLRPYLNKVIVADEPGVCTTEILPVRCYGPFDPNYFRSAMQSPMFLEYVNAKSYGMKMPRLGTEDGRLAPFPLPPLPEQFRIVAKVDELMALCDRLDAEQGQAGQVQGHWVEAALAQLAGSADADEFARHWQHLTQHFDTLFTTPDSITQLEATLLQLAVRGKLVPQDPNDEPASTLLQKIRAEKDRLIAESKIKKDKPLPPISDEEKPFELPEGWEWTTLTNICSLITDGEHITPERIDDPCEPPLVTAKNVRDGYMDYEVTDFVPRPIAEKCWGRCKPRSGDILMVSVGATLGRLTILREEKEMVLVRSVTLLRPTSIGINVDFIAIHLRSPASQAEIWGAVKQSAQPCLYLAKSCALKIALPPLPEQSRIVTKLEALFALTAGLKTQLAKAQQTQALLAEALLDEVIA